MFLPILSKVLQSGVWMEPEVMQSWEWNQKSCNHGCRCQWPRCPRFPILAYNLLHNQTRSNLSNVSSCLIWGYRKDRWWWLFFYLWGACWWWNRWTKTIRKFYFQKGYGMSVPKKQPYLPNWRNFIRSGMAMNNFIASMNVFSKGFCIFTTDLRAERHSNWYYIRSVSLVIIRWV